MTGSRTRPAAWLTTILLALGACGGGGGGGDGGGGALTWLQSAGGVIADRGLAVAPFGDGSFVATGFYHWSAEFGQGTGAVTLDAPASQSAFLVRYGATGAVLWARQAVGGLGRAVATLPDGSVFVVGRIGGSATFGEGAGAVTLTTRGGEDVFVARYGADGSFEWVRQAGGTGDDEAFGVAAFPDGSCVVAGHFESTATFGEGAAATDLSAVAAADVFLARYGSTGGLAWVRQAGGSDYEEAEAVAAFSDGSCVVTGGFYFDITLGEGPGAVTLTAVDLNTFLARYDDNGSLLWAKQVQGDFPDNNRGTGVASFADGSCAVVGWFANQATFGEGPSAMGLTSNGGTDAYLARYDGAGDLLWARNGGGGSDDRAYAVAAFPDGSCVLTGRFEEAATFGEGPGAVALVANGTWDAFVARHAVDGSLAWATAGGGSELDAGHGIAAFGDGSWAVTGEFGGGSAIFGTGPSAVLLTGSGVEIFVGRYGADGGL